MKIKLDSSQGYVTKEGKFNQKDALINAGVKAAICFMELLSNNMGDPDFIRKSESDDKLIMRGINTIFCDHTTPTEHQLVSLEITGIPKALCMVLNNEHQYTTCERSLRYTKVEPNNNISSKEVQIYNKWLNIFQHLITDKYFDFYRRFNKTDEGTKKAICKLAQETARYHVSVFMPTTLTYTVPFAQINKICKYMERIIDNPLNHFEKLLIPYFKDFINQLKELKVVLTKKDLYDLCDGKNMCEVELRKKLAKKIPDFETYKNNEELVYKNNKNIDLSLFSERNKFSGINENNEYGHNIMYNNYESFACLAQEQRHRTIDCEMMIPEEFKSFIPPLIVDNKDLVNMWEKDMWSVSDYYPQGQLIKVSRKATIENLIDFVSKERNCDRAQLEIMQAYFNDIIPDIYNAYEENKQIKLAETLQPYVKKLRCQYKDYKCPSPCGHPRINRKI